MAKKVVCHFYQNIRSPNTKIFGNYTVMLTVGSARSNSQKSIARKASFLKIKAC